MHSASKLAVALLAGVLASAPVFAAGKSAKGPAVATVNGVAIPESYAESFINEQKAQGTQDSPQLRSAVKEELIRREILSQEARRQGLEKNPAVTSQMALASQAVLIRAYIQDYLRTHPVSDAQLQKDYEAITAKLGGTEYKARHILVENEADAQAIIAKLKKGEKFEDLAKQSKDPGSKDKGGDLGWSTPASYVKPFADALVQLKKGQFTDAPVKSEFGWHVIELEDTRPLTPPSFDQVKPQLQQRAQQQLVEQMVQNLRAKARVN